MPVGQKKVAGRLLRGQIPDSKVTVYFVEQPQYFDRDHLYGPNNADYRDNCEKSSCKATGP